MLRLSAFVIVMIGATGTALAADQVIPPHASRHVRYPPRHVVVMVGPDRDALISPSIPRTPLLPGSSTLPGYYGRPFDYDYQGPYYGGGPYPSYFFRLPYACGIYGYC
jgi:hypothetical protein